MMSHNTKNEMELMVFRCLWDEGIWNNVLKPTSKLDAILNSEDIKDTFVLNNPSDTFTATEIRKLFIKNKEQAVINLTISIHTS